MFHQETSLRYNLKGNLSDYSKEKFRDILHKCLVRGDVSYIYKCTLYLITVAS